MSRATGTIRVEPIKGERMCFHVESWSKPSHPHRVDLLSFDGRSACSCHNWQIRCWPVIRDGKPELPYKQEGTSLCRHVWIAREVFLKRLLKRMAKEEQPK